MANILNISQQDSHHCVQSLCHRMDHHSCYRSRWIRWRVLFLILNKKYGIKISKIYDCSNIKGKTMIQISYPWIRAWFGSSYKPVVFLKFRLYRLLLWWFCIFFEAWNSQSSFTACKRVTTAHSSRFHDSDMRQNLWWLNYHFNMTHWVCSGYMRQCFGLTMSKRQSSCDAP